MSTLRTTFQFGVLPKMPMKDNRLSIQSKAIYAYLCAYAGNDGQSFPSTKLMEYELGISKNTLFKYLKELRLSGYVTVEKVKTNNNQFQNNLYILNSEPCTNSCDTAFSDTANCDTTKNNDTKNNNTINKYLHHLLDDGLSLFKILEEYSLKTFGKKLRNHKGIYELDTYNYMDKDMFIKMLEDNITKYDNCNLDYLEVIQERFK